MTDGNTNSSSWDAGDNANHMSVGDWQVSADGNISVLCSGNELYLGAGGSSTSVLITSNTTTSIVSGPVSFMMGLVEEGAGAAVLDVGTEGELSLYAGIPDEGSIVQLKPEEMTLQLGVIDLGAIIKLTPESIKLQVGPPGAGASIEITPESITLKVAEVSMTMTPEGITEDVAEVTREMTPEGHNFTAAETEYNIGVSGVAEEGPTKEAEYEAGTVENETLGSDTTDAAKNEDAGIMMTE